MTEEIITISADDGARLHARLWKATEPKACVVITHGVVSHSLWLTSIAERISEQGIHVLAVDRRGAGLNTMGRGDAPTGDVLLADLRLWMEKAEGLKMPIHLCGFCWGANYVVNFVHHIGAPIHSLSLLAPSLFPSELVLQQPFNVSEQSEPTEPPTVPLEKFTSGPMYSDFILPDPLRIKAVSPRMNGIMQNFSQGIWMKFLRIESPILVVLGDKDEVVNNEATQTLFTRVKNSKSIIRGVDAQHGIQFDAPDETSSLLTEWILNNTPSHDAIDKEPKNA